MKRVLSRGAIVWLMTIGSPCLGGDNGAGSAAAPNPPMLDYIVGRWEVDAIDPTTGQAEKIRYEVQRFVGNAWVSGSAKSADPSFAAKDVWGHDPLTGEVIRTVFDSSGTYAIVRSPGWKDDGTPAAGTFRVGGTYHLVLQVTLAGTD